MSELVERLIQFHDNVLAERAKEKDPAYREARPWAFVQWGGYTRRFEDSEFRELITDIREAAAALSRTEAELELAVEQLFCAAVQRDALALALTQIQDHWPVSGELESYRLQQDMRASESMRNIAKRALAAAADIQDDKETT